MKIIKDITSDQERAFYSESNTVFQNIKIKGPEDGESAFKECQNIVIEESVFDLRYPFWHNDLLAINESELTSNCRAALWYSKNISMSDSIIDGVKVYRECQKIKVKDSKINSPEPFWFCQDILINGGSLAGEYAFFKSENIEIHNLNFKGKYSFQYVKNLTIYDSYLDTKDAFWHAENVTVYNSIIIGAYLAWYGKNIKLVNCKIIGTQPICYTDNILMENCTMEETDYSFEYSTVYAEIKGEIESIKNPYKGRIKAGNIKEIIIDEYAKPDSQVEIIAKNKNVA
ncbi:MAG: DUF3737 family protein [Bacilli bacterium]|nr:DUF3737 family protein [Bacilli bacterium]